MKRVQETWHPMTTTDRFLSPPRLWDVLIVLVIAAGVYAMSCRVREQESRMAKLEARR